MATEAVYRSFRVVIEQIQPKQRRHTAKIDLGSPKHADFAVPNRDERNRRFISRIAESLTKAFAILNSVSELSDVSQPIKPQILKCVVKCTIEPPQTAQLFTFDKPEAASADGYSKTGQNALVSTRPIICCFAPASRGRG